MLSPWTFVNARTLCVVCVLAVVLPALADPADAPAPSQKANEAIRVRELRSKLAQSVTLENGIEGNTPLREAFEFLGSRHDIAIVIDTQAFKAEGNDTVEETPVRLPKMTGIKLGTVLQMIAAQANGTFRIRPGYVEVTPKERARPDAWKENRDFAPTINAEFSGHPLDSALRELSDASGISVVMDGRIGEKARTSVTATLNNVPIDTAVFILADMADLRPVVLDNVLYVTTKANAEELTVWRDKQRNKPSGTEKPLSPTERKSDSK
jgi:hypothetical protein